MVFLCIPVWIHLYHMRQTHSLSFLHVHPLPMQSCILQNKRLGRLDYRGFDMFADPRGGSAECKPARGCQTLAASSECLLIPMEALLLGVFPCAKCSGLSVQFSRHFNNYSFADARLVLSLAMATLSLIHFLTLSHIH